MRGLSIFPQGVQRRVQAVSARWIVAALALTAGAWLVGLAGLLAVANRVHDDVPVMLAVKLPLLASHPELVFGGESRTAYQVDPVLAAHGLRKRIHGRDGMMFQNPTPERDVRITVRVGEQPGRQRNEHKIDSGRHQPWQQ